MQLSREASDFYSEDCGLEPRMGGMCASPRIARLSRGQPTHFWEWATSEVTPLLTPQSPTYRAADLAREQIRERRESTHRRESNIPESAESAQQRGPQAWQTS